MKSRYTTLSALLLLVIFFTSTTANAQVVTTSLNTTVRDISDLDIGFNRRSDVGAWWTDNSFIDLVAEMNPDIVRYPAGTQANYWDWREGKFLDNPHKTWGSKEVLKIPGFVNALPDRTKIVYVVNMARPTPSTGVALTADEATLKSDATLTAKISDMLDAIATFVAQGKEPYAVELGNEFYFGNEESGIFHIEENGGVYYGGWDATNNQPYQANSKKDATEFTAKLYVKQSSEIVAAIKAMYPNIKFILTTTKLETNAQAREVWNNTIFNELDTNYPTLKSDIYAVSQHHYLNDKYGVQTVISDNASAKVAIAEGIQYPIDKKSDYDMVSDDYKIWYTEYGEVKKIAEETWASGVRYAALVYSWMSLGDKVGQLGYHHISDNTVIKTGSPMKLAPVGIASKLVAQAIADMDELQEINFTNNPISVNSIKSLYGYKFKNDEKETLLIINTSDTNFSELDFNTLFTYTGQPKMTQYHSNAPYTSGVYDGHSNIQSTISDVNNTASINNFSVTVVEAANNTLSVDTNQLEKSLKIYPNPVENILTIEATSKLQSIAIYTLNGTRVLRENNGEKNLNVSQLSSGIYIIKIETDKGFQTSKLIKY